MPEDKSQSSIKENRMPRGILRPIWIVWPKERLPISEQADAIMKRYQKFKAKPKQILIHDTFRGLALAEMLKDKDLPILCDDLVNVSIT